MSALFLFTAAFTTQAGQVAYWIMQSQNNDPCGFTGIADSAQHGTVTGNCAAAGATNDPLITFNTLVLSTNVPPTNMFMSGYGPGTNSYNAESLNGQNGALFFPQDQYGNEFTTALGGSWTFEMFFKTDGNQSGNGIEELLMNHENSLFYILDLNESAAGGLRLAIYTGSGFPTVDLTSRNFADGNWYYVACSFNHTNNLMTILCRSQSGVVYSNSVTTSGPPVEGNPGNLFIGRNDYNNDSGARNFNGLIANVAISSGVVANSQFIGVISGTTTTAVSSSTNPAVPSQSIIFTATVTTTAAGTPSGTVQFKTNGVAFGSAVTLSGGSASSLSITNLPHGSNAITAVYSGDANFLGSTGSVSQVIDTPPAAGLQYLTTVMNTALNASATTLAGLNYDADADHLTITAVSNLSTNGFTVSLNGTSNTNITYTISDGFPGGTNICTADVTVTLGKATSVIYATSGAGGVFNLVGYGIPGHGYDVQHSTNVTFSSYTILATNVIAAPNGVVPYTDNSPTSPGFYRLAVH